MHNAIHAQLDALVRELHEQTKKNVLLEIDNAREEMQHALAVKMDATTRDTGEQDAGPSQACQGPC